MLQAVEMLKCAAVPDTALMCYSRASSVRFAVQHLSCLAPSQSASTQRGIDTFLPCSVQGLGVQRLVRHNCAEF